jgi:hypothetical protein
VGGGRGGIEKNKKNKEPSLVFDEKNHEYSQEIPNSFEESSKDSSAQHIAE